MSETTTATTSGEQLIGETPCMRQLREQVRRLSSCDVTVLLQGESGTGKEVVSRCIHGMSSRREGPFIAVNCTAVNETLLESELFGHEAGAFTGARHATLGFFRAANEGTILLDEIGDMGESLQSSLLRVLENHAVTPVGSTVTIPVNVRVIAATHQDLAQAVRDGSFREDLFYRLNVVCLCIPPLRQRKDDIPLLAEHLLQRVGALLELPLRTFSPQAMDVLVQYDWPGNIRQLSNVIQRAYVLGSGRTIEVEDLPHELLVSPEGTSRKDGFPPLQEAIRGHVQQALRMTNGTRTQAARLLGIDRKSLWRMMRRHGIA